MHDVTIKGKGREGSARCSCGWQSRAGWSRRYASLMARLHRGAAPMSPDTSQPQDDEIVGRMAKAMRHAYIHDEGDIFKVQARAALAVARPRVRPFAAARRHR